MNVDGLPPEMLNNILGDKGFSLNKRISLRAVSRKWKEAIEDRLGKLTQLAIWAGVTPSSIAGMLHLSIQGDQLEDMASFIGRLFPALKSLTVNVGSREAICLQAHLLPLYTLTLEQLNVHDHYFIFLESEVELSTEDLAAVGKAFNQLQKLTKLAFKFDGSFAGILPYLQPTLKRLKSCAIDGSFADGGQFGSAFCKSLSDECTNLEIPGTFLYRTNGNLRASLKRLVLNSLQVNDNLMYAKEFAALESLCIYKGMWPMNAPLTDKALANFSSLLHLSNVEIYCTEYKELQLTKSPCAQQALVSVKRLYINIASWSSRQSPHDRPFDGHQFFSSLAAWFPHVEQFVFSCEPAYYPLVQEHVYLLCSLKSLKLE